LVETAKVNGQEPYTWRRHVLERLPHAQSVADYEALLPWEHSKGARLELQIAERLGMTVVNAHDPVSPISTDQRLLSNKDCHIS
jgi:hypothetical protein